MHLPLTYATAIARVIRNGDLLQATIFDQSGTDPHVTPSLGVMVEDFSSPHPHMHRGVLVLRYTYDRDATPAEAAAADLQQAVDYLTSPSGRSAIHDATASASIWTRILGPAEYATATLDDRRASHDARLPFWFQTAL